MGNAYGEMYDHLAVVAWSLASRSVQGSGSSVFGLVFRVRGMSNSFQEKMYGAERSIKKLIWNARASTLLRKNTAIPLSKKRPVAWEG